MNVNNNRIDTPVVLLTEVANPLLRFGKTLYLFEVFRSIVQKGTATTSLVREREDWEWLRGRMERGL